MARASVELIVEAAKAVNPLRQTERQTKRVENQFEKARKSTKRVEAALILMGRKGANALRDLEKNSARLGKRMSGLRANVAKLAIGFAAVKSAQAGIARAESVRRIQFLGQAYGEATELQAAATAASEKFGLSQTEANKALANVFARLRPVGASLEDITSIYNGFNTVARISGASSVEASNAFTQLAQALGSGALRGDEFNSIAEQVPGILTAISQETGVAQGDLRKFAAEGKITSDVVLKALKRIEKEGAGQLEAALGGPAQAIKDFQNATEDVQIALTEATIPELAKSFKILAQIITDLKPVIEAVGSFAAKVLGGISDTIQRIQDPSRAQKEMQDHLAEGRRKAAMRKRGFQNLPVNDAEQAEFNALFAAVVSGSGAQKPVGKPTLLTNTTLTDKDKGKKAGAKGKTDLERQQEAAAELLKNLKERTTLAQAMTSDEQRMLQLRIDQANVEEDFSLLSTEIQDKLKEQHEILFAQENVTQTLKDAAADRAKKEEEIAKAAAEQAKKLEELYQRVGSAIENGIVNGIMSAIDGAKSLQEILASVLRDVGSLFLQFGVRTGLNAISPDIFPMAEGGYVSGPTNALIGEGGEPEYVIPESKMRESMSRYSRGSRGSSVIPEVGGSGTSSGGGGLAVAAPIDVRYTVERINSVDYVTADQFQAGMQQAATQGAKQGEQQTLKRLQMSGSARRRIGI